MNFIVAYDFGTSGVKAALVDFEGNFIAEYESGYPLLTPKPGFVEQNPKDYWKSVCNATKHVIKKAGIDKASVRGLSYGTQGMGIIPVDKDGNVLYNNITWVDTRASRQSIRINKILGEEAQNAADVVSKLLWLKENEPEVFAKTKYFLDCTGYLTYKSTGIMVMELTNSGPYSLDPQVIEKKERLYAAAGISLDKMPPLKTCSEYVGNLTLKAAEELGLTTDTAVFMGTGDTAAAAAGCGCCKPGDAHIYIGSSAWLSVIKDSERVKNPSPGIYQLYSINKDYLLYGGCVQSAGMTLNWAIDQFYAYEKQAVKADTGGGSIFDFINRELEAIKPGSNSLIATPWLYGEHCPVLDENAKAVFFNITNLHDRRHIINAIMEGVCYSLRGQMEYYNKDTGDTIKRVGAVGGGALSNHWMQMMADVLNVPVYVTQNVLHAGAMGVAAVAGVGLGLYDFNEVEKFITIEKTFYPREEYIVTYDKLYNVFKRIYPTLKDLYTELNT